jgi:ligand-binding sensor domain-containing protein
MELLMVRITTLFILVFSISPSEAQFVVSYDMDAAQMPVSGLAGNGITDIFAADGNIWFGTGHGLSRTTDGGETFETFGTSHGLGRGSVSAIWISGDTVIVATAGDTITEISSTSLPYGSGLAISVDRGLTWRFIPQPPKDFTPIQNLTYDIAILNRSIWITNFGGGLLKSDDWGISWTTNPPDSFLFDPGGRLNHRCFSTLATEGDLWVGTAGGINKSPDGGNTWTNYNHANQQHPISGDFVVAIAYQKTETRAIIWAATWKAEGEDEFYAVSKTENNGRSWTTALHDEKAHNFCFDDSVVYVATDNGLYKSVDYGETWYLFPPITDTITDEKVYTTEVYSVYAENGTVWAGTADGLARTQNNGYSWDIRRAFQSTGKNSTPRTYAYPNPFSPLRHNRLGQDGFVRFQYNTLKNTRVTVKVYDFAMDLVTTVVEDKERPGPRDYAEVWNGRNDYGDQVANGVYFYSVELEGDGTYWGKVMIVN